MLWGKRTFLLAVGLAACVPSWAQSVVFINPGKSNEVYWSTSTRAMQSAARDLGMQLEVLYAERDHTRLAEFAREIAARRKRPDFAIVSNENSTGLEMLKILDAAGVKTFFAYSTIQAAERTTTGGPREKYRGWIGSLEPHAEDAGYLTAKALIAKARSVNAQAPDGKIHLVAIAGDRTTTSSIRRNEGMTRAVAEAGDAVVDQMVYAIWNREKAEEQAEWLFDRYPNARVVWAGNDLMAFGAMSAYEKHGSVPGKDVFFSGVNTSKEAFDALHTGRMTAVAGGHFICGAWAMVMIYDYAHGRDFKDEGLDLDRSMFTSFDPETADIFLARYSDNFDSVGFRRYSKALNPRLKRYDFDFAQLLH
jgi:ABC-type sugar transport system substrate-binding protein